MKKPICSLILDWRKCLRGFILTGLIIGIGTPLVHQLIANGYIESGKVIYFDIYIYIFGVSTILNTITILIFFLLLLIVRCSLTEINLKIYIAVALTYKFFTVLLSYSESISQPMLLVFGHGFNDFPAKIFGRPSQPPFYDERLILHVISIVLWLLTAGLFWKLSLSNNINNGKYNLHNYSAK